MKYDIIIAGSGLYGSVIAHEAKKRGLRVLVVEKRNHTGGNIYCKEMNGIHVHYYGAHIFHTNKEHIWQYVKQFVRFNNYVNSPLAHYKGELYNLPFNMNTFYQLWKVKTPAEARKKIREQTAPYQYEAPQNLEEMALKLVGPDIYEKLIKGYTEKQWGKPATEIPAFIIQRLPLRFTFDNNYFNDPYQGIPIGGYNTLINALLEGIEVRLNTDFLDQKDDFIRLAKLIVYTGEIDRFFDYRFGKLEYRSLRFEHELIEGCKNYQGNAVVNYTEREVPYTRILEHKHFEFGKQKDTVITREYSADFANGLDPYYPINDERNNTLYQQYKKLADETPHIHFGGRLGEYKYYNMDQVIESALNASQNIFKSVQLEYAQP